MKNKLLPLIIVLIGGTANAQVGIGTLNPNKSAQLEVLSNDRGILIPRVNLDGISDTRTITNGNVESLLVYNSNTTSTINPGYYYWFANKWNRLINQNDLVNLDTNTKNRSFQVENGSLLLTDTEGNTVSVSLLDLNIVTTLVNNNNGSYTYTSENGTTTLINVVADVQNNFQEIVNNNDVLNILKQVIRNNAGNVSYDGSQFTYTDQNGNSQIVNFQDIVQNNQKTTAVVNGLTTDVTSTTNGNQTDYKVEVKDGAITTSKLADNSVTPQKMNSVGAQAGQVLTVNQDGTVSYQDLPVANIPRTTSLINGTNTTVESVIDANDANNTNWKVNVQTSKGALGANASNLGVVKEADVNPTVNVSQNGDLSVNYEHINAVKEIGSNYNATLADAILLGNAENATLTITLPTPVSNKGKRIIIKKDDLNEDTYVNVSGTISGVTGVLYTALPYSGWEFVSDGNVWRIINKF